MLISSLPGPSETPRMRVWRALKARGAALLRDGVHLLPATSASDQLMREQASHISAAGGSAYEIDFESGDETASPASCSITSMARSRRSRTNDR
jgi:hypothetical protein